jgi:hypothetical protein
LLTWEWEPERAAWRYWPIGAIGEVLTVTLVIFSLALGGLLAQRYSILALPPATLVVVMIVVSLNLMWPTGVWPTVARAIVATFSLQIGYFVGLGCAHLLSTRMSNKLSVYSHSTSTQNSAR